MLYLWSSGNKKVLYLIISYFIFENRNRKCTHLTLNPLASTPANKSDPISEVSRTKGASFLVENLAFFGRKLTLGIMSSQTELLGLIGTDSRMDQGWDSTQRCRWSGAVTLSPPSHPRVLCHLRKEETSPDSIVAHSETRYVSHLCQGEKRAWLMGKKWNLVIMPKIWTLRTH